MGKKVLFVNQEIKPYVPESEMSTFGYDLPTAMQGEGYEIRSFMPKWGNINERRGQLHEVIRLSGINVIIEGDVANTVFGKIHFHIEVALEVISSKS